MGTHESQRDQHILSPERDCTILSFIRGYTLHGFCKLDDCAHQANTMNVSGTLIRVGKRISKIFKHGNNAFHVAREGPRRITDVVGSIGTMILVQSSNIGNEQELEKHKHPENLRLGFVLEKLQEQKVEMSSQFFLQKTFSTKKICQGKNILFFFKYESTDVAV
jgi:hypothetical protein